MFFSTFFLGPAIGHLNLVHFAGQEVALNGLSNGRGVLGLDGVRHRPELLRVVVVVLLLTQNGLLKAKKKRLNFKCPQKLLTPTDFVA